MVGDVLGVVLDRAQQRRTARVLPRHPEEVQPRRFGYAALMHQPAVRVEDGQLHERVIELEAGRPDDRAGTQPTAVAKAHL